MSTRAYLAENGETLTNEIPLTIRKRGGRKLMIARDEVSAWAPARACVDNAMVKAVARAYRWRSLIEAGAYSTIEEISSSENINATYVGRILRLTLLAPDILEAILDGRQPRKLQLKALLKRFSVDWLLQRSAEFMT